jgi:DNA-binding SARP family transcriptional activator/tetratricopeptide (TPR) repeat protein
LLATAGRLGIARDKCLLYLWPESDTLRARNSLHQTLYSLRGDLGSDVVDFGQQIALNPKRLTTDLWDFEAALERDDPDAAIALYAGPFLDGFSLDGLREFDEWVESERLQVGRRYAGALEQAARRATDRGDHARSIDLWRKRANLEPLSAPPTVGLMHALVAAGDRAAALTTGREHIALVRRELACDADPSVTALVAGLRAPTPAVTPAIIAEAARDVPGAVPSSATPSSTTRFPTRDRHPVSRRLLMARIGALAAVLLLSAALALNWRTRDPAPQSTEVIAVFPFTVAGNAELEYLSTGLVDMLSTSLDGAGSIRGIDPRAIMAWLDSRRLVNPRPADAAAAAGQLGAGRYVLGSVAGTGTRLRILASLYENGRPDSAIASAMAEGAPDNLFQLVDDVASQLLAGSLTGPRHRLVRVAAATTQSLAALKHYLTGEQELRTGRHPEAAESFQNAIRLDSTFALAYYRLTITADWLGRDSLARAAAEAAGRHAARLSAHDEQLVRAAIAQRQGDAASAERIYRDIVDDYPDDVEAWLQLGEVLFHQNPMHGRSATEARQAFERVLALDPDDEEALLHLARIASLEGRDSQADTLGRRVLQLASSSQVLELRAFRAFALGDRDSWKRVTRELVDRPPEVPPVTALEVALFMDDLDGAERFASILTDARYSDGVRGLGHRILARAAAARGQWYGARAQLDTARRFDEVAALELRSLVASLGFLNVPEDDVRGIRTELERWNAPAADQPTSAHSAGHTGLHAAIRRHRLGLVAARLGDTRAVTAQADSLDREASVTSGRATMVVATFASSLRAHAAFAANDAATALRHLDATAWASIESGFEAEAGDRYLRARVLESLGRHEEARAWYRAIAQRATHELVYLAPSRLRESMVACRLGDMAGAAEAHADASRLWHEAAPPLREELSRVGRELRELGVSLAAAHPPG